MGAGVVSDESDWPRFRIRFQGPGIDLDDVAAFRREMDRVLSRRERFVSIVDGRRVTEMPGPLVRKAFADSLAKHRLQLSDWCAGEAIVVESNFLRGLITAIFWITSPAHPSKTFTEPGAARDWTLTQLESR